MSEDGTPPTPLVQETGSIQEPQQKSRLRLLIGGGFSLIVIAAAVYCVSIFSGEDAAETTQTDVPSSVSEQKIAGEEKIPGEKPDAGQAAQAVSGRYIPAYMNDQGRILPLGDCSHTYIELDQDGILKRSGNRNVQYESFKKFSFSEPEDVLKTTYIFNGETEGPVDSAKGLSTSLPKWRYSEYEIAYVKEENLPHLMIIQTDQFELVSGNQETISSQGYYLPCMTHNSGGAS